LGAAWLIEQGESHWKERVLSKGAGPPGRVRARVRDAPLLGQVALTRAVFCLSLRIGPLLEEPPVVLDHACDAAPQSRAGLAVPRLVQIGEPAKVLAQLLERLHRDAEILVGHGPPPFTR